MSVIVKSVPSNAAKVSVYENNRLITQDGEVILTADNKEIILNLPSYYVDVSYETYNQKFNFQGWYLNGVQVSLDVEHSILIDSSLENIIEARFEQILFDVNVVASPNIVTVYQSAKQVEFGDSVTIRARHINGYKFIRWDDGNNEIVRTLNISQDISLVAIYSKIIENNSVINYRAYIKEQTDLTAVPKAFLNVLSFTIRQDLLSSVTSSIECEKIPSNINEGDLLILYDPRAITIYQGVVKQIKDTTITCTQLQSFYSGECSFYVPTATTIEESANILFTELASGKYHGSSYVDRAVERRLGGITISSVNDTVGKLSSTETNTIMSVENFIYSLYENYGVMFMFTINYSGNNYVSIQKYSGDALKIGNNTDVVSNIKTIVQQKGFNKLVILKPSKTFGYSRVLTTNGEIKSPSQTDVGEMFALTNTKVVVTNSDTAAEIDALANKYLHNYYNHKITFDLLIDNSIYSIGDMKLGRPISIWIDGKNFDTALTGIEISKDEGKNIEYISCICGNVRTKLSSKINMNGGY